MLRRYALSFTAVAILSSCGSAQPITAPGAMRQSQASMLTTHPERGGSWMLPVAKNDDLLYVAASGNVYVVSYRSGKLVGALNVVGVGNICSDRVGNVFVPESGYDRILEYAHGSMSPIKALPDGDIALACSVDPRTNNLAVSNAASAAGEVAIFPDEDAPALYHRDPSLYSYGLSGYDDHGNLFLDGAGEGG